MERININGKWYVEETPNEINDMDITYTISSLHEDNEILLEAIILLKDNPLNNNRINKYSEDISISVKPKAPTGPSEYWDNNVWIRKLRSGDKEALKEIENEYTLSQQTTIKAFLRKLEEDGWI
jgi:hypothetical protein